MMGTTHAVSACPPWLLAAPLVCDQAWQVPAGLLLAAGAAYGPDIDHHNSTATHALGPLGRPVWWVTSRFMDGHRGGTHSYAAAAAVGLLAGAAGWWAGAGFAWWAAVAVTIGWLAHILGDRLTPQPVAVHWPFDRAKKGFPITLLSTGKHKAREVALSVLLGAVSVALFAQWVVAAFPSLAPMIAAGT